MSMVMNVVIKMVHATHRILCQAVRAGDVGSIPNADLVREVRVVLDGLFVPDLHHKMSAAKAAWSEIQFVLPAHPLERPDVGR